MRILWVALLVGGTAAAALGEPPSASYIFPAGAQRGTTVEVRVGGHYFHGDAGFALTGPGTTSSPRIRETETVWFEGPLLPLSASQRQEDYPRDHAATIQVAEDAPLGVRYWQAWTSQGVTSSRVFVIGDLPEVVEQEIDGAPIPTRVTLPVTINGRIFPREEMDIWTFEARRGQSITCAVQAQALGSPLETRLQIADAQGTVLHEAIAPPGSDPQIRFAAPDDGTYQVRLQDVQFGGLQNYVYRLTITAGPWVESIYPLGARRGSTVRLQAVGQGMPAEGVEVAVPADAPDQYTLRWPINGQWTNPVVLEVSDLPEVGEQAANDQPANLEPLEAPVVCNGRIERPGDVDHFAVRLTKDANYDIDLRASRLGSPLDSVVAILDAEGKPLAENDHFTGNETDSRLAFKAPADGVYWLRVNERFASRGGEPFAYRLVVRPAPPADFELTLADDAVIVERDLPEDESDESKPKPRRGGAPQPKLAVTAQRLGGFDGEIELLVEGLPPEVTVEGTKIAAKQPRTELVFRASPKAKIDVARLVIRGQATIADRPVVRTAAVPVPRGSPPREAVRLAVAMPTPFKFHAPFVTLYAARGSVYRRTYAIDRNGFSGPLTVRLADKQVRHLQGLHGPELTVPPQADSFEYAVVLPPWMRIGRTARSTVMLLGTVRDFDDTEHRVSYTSGTQNDQIIAIVTAARLSVEIEPATLRLAPQSMREIGVRVRRGSELADQPVRVELVVPRHMKGISAEPVELAAGQEQAVLSLRLAELVGPVNMPLVVRATTLGPGDPHTGEAKLELVPAAAEAAAVAGP